MRFAQKLLSFFVHTVKSIDKITKKEIFILYNLPIDLADCTKTFWKVENFCAVWRPAVVGCGAVKLHKILAQNFTSAFCTNFTLQSHPKIVHFVYWLSKMHKVQIQNLCNITIDFSNLHKKFLTSLFKLHYWHSTMHNKLAFKAIFFYLTIFKKFVIIYM